VLKTHALSERDASFATRLAYGTVACRGTLDEAVGRFVTGSRSLEPMVADALALSAYEILYLSTPARAAVSEGVELVRSVQVKAAGLANAVLRRLAEEADSFPWGDPETETDALARLHGHPLWLAELWVREIGREAAAAIMAADNEPAPLFLAHLPFESGIELLIDQLSRDGAGPVEGPLPGCLIAQSPAAAVRSTALTRGMALVADAGAQYAAAVVRPAPGQHIVEIGAGRGTKALMMAGLARLAGGPARITAVDSHSFKLQALERSAERLGVSEIVTVTADATLPARPGMPDAGSADAVLVDAPCSGLGTLRRHPDRRWRAKPDDIETLAAIGGRLLAAAAELVKPGGFVVYSTCTIARGENEDVISAFLDQQVGRGFTVDPLDADTPRQWSRFVTSEGYFQSLPEPGGPDGHFVARLVRTN
jgi:16S rRNA (cytosine967-C5)-methyltransferase